MRWVVRWVRVGGTAAAADASDCALLALVVRREVLPVAGVLLRPLRKDDTGTISSSLSPSSCIWLRSFRLDDGTSGAESSSTKDEVPRECELWEGSVRGCVATSSVIQ